MKVSINNESIFYKKNNLSNILKLHFLATRIVFPDLSMPKNLPLTVIVCRLGRCRYWRLLSVGLVSKRQFVQISWFIIYLLNLTDSIVSSVFRSFFYSLKVGSGKPSYIIRFICSFRLIKQLRRLISNETSSRYWPQYSESNYSNRTSCIHIF